MYSSSMGRTAATDFYIIFKLKNLLHFRLRMATFKKSNDMTQINTAYKVKANEFEFSFTKEEIDAADLVQRSPVEFNLLKDHRSVNVKLVETDRTARKLTIEVEGESFDIEIKEELDQMLEKMGFGAVSNRHIKELKAPMPGLVLEIAVTEGQAVTEGEKILILVAMKMENSIMIHTNATIKRIAVSAGQAVEKGQLLVELE
jgi:acetyl/propionyl-CoA carboxylase alpha subunit